MTDTDASQSIPENTVDESTSQLAEILTTKRDRKSATFFSFSEFNSKDAQDNKSHAVAAIGSGIALGQYDFFCQKLDKVKSDDEALKLLHMLFYNRKGKRVETKKNIRIFNGFDSNTTKEELVEKITSKKQWSISILKDILELCGLEKSGNRTDLIDRLATYLLNPWIVRASSGKSNTPGKRRISSSGSKKKSSKSDEIDDVDDIFGEDFDEETLQSKKSKTSSNEQGEEN